VVLGRLVDECRVQRCLEEVKHWQASYRVCTLKLVRKLPSAHPKSRIEKHLSLLARADHPAGRLEAAAMVPPHAQAGTFAKLKTAPNSVKTKRVKPAITTTAFVGVWVVGVGGVSCTKMKSTKRIAVIRSGRPDSAMRNISGE